MNKQSKIQNLKSKIAIVGAGPAGASLAVRLAKEDFRVVLIEREKFPRQKLCGEFISPECLAHFRDLDVFDEMIAVGGDRITKTVFYEPGGKSAAVPSNWFGGAEHQGALSISRAEMDFRLLEKARQVGVEVLEETKVVGVFFKDKRVSGVRVRTNSGETAEISADLTIDATGRARVLGKLVEKKKGRRGEGETRRQGDRETKSKIQNLKSKIEVVPNPKSKIQNRLVGFKTHLRNVHLERGVCEIYFFRGGYGGLSYVEDGLANHCFLIRADVVKEFGGDAGRIVENVVFGNKRAYMTLKDSEPVLDWLAVSVDGFGRKDLNPAPGLFTVGDASAFIDPFTGSGMLMALEGAEILARTIGENRFSPETIAPNYSLRHRQKFQKRLRICAFMRRAAFVPALAKTAISVLSLSKTAREILARSTRKTVPIIGDEK